MGRIIKAANKNRVIQFAVKVAISVWILSVILNALFWNGLNSCYNSENYNYQNNFEEQEVISLAGEKVISQRFVAKGDILNNVSLYFGEAADTNAQATVEDSSGKTIAERSFFTGDYIANAWNQIGLESTGLQTGNVYTLLITSDNDLAFLVLDQGEIPVEFGECSDLRGALTIGFSFTSRDLLFSNLSEIAVKTLVALFLGGCLCFAVWKIEKLVDASHCLERKAFLPALYYSGSFVLLFNPIAEQRNKVTEFGRVIGQGILYNTDVSKRTSNFNSWFILFAVSFGLFYLMFNCLYQEEKSEESKKVEKFQNHYMVLANCCLLFTCISYFQNEEAETTFQFTSYAVLLIAIVTQLYIILRLDRFISAEDFGKLGMLSASLAYPVAILLGDTWESGRALLGVLLAFAFVMLLFCAFCLKFLNREYFFAGIDAGVTILPCLPLITSVYIELIHILNQHSIFVAYPGKWYLAIFVLTLSLWALTAVAWKTRKKRFVGWKRWAFLIFVVGIACLSRQIPIVTTHNLDLFESANYGVLINDFLNFGDIPIVNHYGGHMMTSVWEGIIYGLLNQDYAGAVVSPYAGLLDVALFVLFFFLLKVIWNDELALLTTLFFPFYSAWYYYGLGMLVCLAAVAYVKKNSYFRAAVLWATFIWCALYRLDLGVAFGIALIVALVFYIGATKNRQAVKELGLTLLCWGIVGVGIWFSICIIKGINPIHRLLEFLYVSMSNQNWAYPVIGNTGMMVFSWAYVIVPFAVVIGLLYTCLSKYFRQEIGVEKWILLLIFGWSYIFNFSRGLVRHSLAEGVTYVAIWCGYIFIAMFLSCYKRKEKVFLPVLMMFILCDSLFMTNSNFKAVSVAEESISEPAGIIDSWELRNMNRGQDSHQTYWEQISESETVVQRVVLSEEVNNYANKFKILDVFLEDNETFVDFINKTTLYPVLNRDCPVYISQSPLQLSGEFSQREFIGEINGVPIVLMPIDALDYRSTSSLDGIANAYRYYLVAEYIYQNYVPLFRYDNDYAVWCLAERYNMYREKLDKIDTETEYVDKVFSSELVNPYNAEVSWQDKAGVIASSGVDPMIVELQRVIDTSAFKGGEMVISVEYETDVSGSMQVFYTTEPNEGFTETKSSTVRISGRGTAKFFIPITDYTRLRLDIPEESTVRIFSVKTGYAIKLIDYGYDGPVENLDAFGNTVYEYTSVFHNYALKHLPQIWAEFDQKDAINNPVLTELVNYSGTYCIAPDSDITNEKGNYLKITARYDGNDLNGYYQSEDEYLETTVILGNYHNGKFMEKARYSMILQEGMHDYLLRCSSDYYWFAGQINAVRIQTNGQVYDLKFSILEGD